MKIGEIGYTFRTTEKIKFNSDRTLMDFDFLIFNLDSIAEAVVRPKQKQDRKKAFEEFITYKKTPIIIIPSNNNTYDVRNPTNVTIESASSFLPNTEFTLDRESGKQINILNQTPFSDFFNKYKNNFHYTSYFSKYNGKPTIEIPFSKKVIAYYNDDCFILPQFVNELEFNESEFLSELIYLVSNYKNKNKAQLPQWCSTIQLPGEDLVQKEISEIESQISQLNDQLIQSQFKYSAFLAHKSILSSTGQALEDQIRDLFIELGIEIIEPDEKRDDLIIKYNDQFAVIEIKGISGSAAEKHAAQLEKWVSDFVMQKEIRPKGILIVNAFKDYPIQEWPLEVFPHQMLKHSVQREHCLISTAQFLAFYYATKANPQKRDELIQSLFDTVGIYSHFADWKKYFKTI